MVSQAVFRLGTLVIVMPPWHMVHDLVEVDVYVIPARVAGGLNKHN